MGNSRPEFERLRTTKKFCYGILLNLNQYLFKKILLMKSLNHPSHSCQRILSDNSRTDKNSTISCDTLWMSEEDQPLVKPTCNQSNAIKALTDNQPAAIASSGGANVVSAIPLTASRYSSIVGVLPNIEANTTTGVDARRDSPFFLSESATTRP